MQRVTKLLLKDEAGAARAVLTVRQTEKGQKILLPQGVRAISLCLDGVTMACAPDRSILETAQATNLSILCERDGGHLFATTRTGEAATIAKWRLLEGEKVPRRPYATAAGGSNTSEASYHLSEANYHTTEGSLANATAAGGSNVEQSEIHNVEQSEIHHACEASASCRQRRYECESGDVDAAGGSNTSEEIHHYAELSDKKEGDENVLQIIAEEAHGSEQETDPLARAKRWIAEGEPFDLFREWMPNSVWAKIQQEECVFLVGIDRDSDRERVLYGIAGARAFPPDEDRLWTFFPTENEEEGYYLTEERLLN